MGSGELICARSLFLSLSCARVHFSMHVSPPCSFMVLWTIVLAFLSFFVLHTHVVVVYLVLGQLLLSGLILLDSGTLRGLALILIFMLDSALRPARLCVTHLIKPSGCNRRKRKSARSFCQAFRELKLCKAHNLPELILSASTWTAERSGFRF